MHSLITARNSAEFDERLAAIERSSPSPSGRDVIRGRLKVEGYGIEQIMRILPPDDRNAAFNRLLLIAFGWSLGDLKNASALNRARELIEACPSNELAQVLVQLARTHGWYDQLASSVARRWPSAANTTDPQQTGMCPPSHAYLTDTDGPSVWSIQSLSPQGKRGLLAVGGLVLSGLFFVLGLVMGMSSSPDPTPAPITTPAPLANPFQGQLNMGGTLTTGLGIDEKLWLIFERTGTHTLFLHPTPCTVENTIEWKCQLQHPPPGEANVSYKVILVRANKSADESLKNAPESGTPQLPPGSTPAEMSLP